MDLMFWKRKHEEDPYAILSRLADTSQQYPRGLVTLNQQRAFAHKLLHALETQRGYADENVVNQLRQLRHGDTSRRQFFGVLLDVDTLRGQGHSEMRHWICTSPTHGQTNSWTEVGTHAANLRKEHAQRVPHKTPGTRAALPMTSIKRQQTIPPLYLAESE